MGYFKARAERTIRNNDNLKHLADMVMEADSRIEVYHHKSVPYIESITFFKGEEINTIGFHDIPFRWSGCGFKEIKTHGDKRAKGGQLEMPFTVADVLNNFEAIQPNHRFKTKEEYLKWYNYLTKYEKNGK